MKAIYINIDPYLAAFAAWLKGGKSGPAPTGPSVPLSVTVPLGETPCIYLPAQSAENPAGKIAKDDPSADWDTVDVVIDGETITVATDPVSSGDLIDSALVPGLSSLAPALKYAAAKFTGDSVKIYLKGAGETSDHEIPFTVLVRREQAQGPVDLVDFTPPAAAIAAGTDLKGATFDGNEIVAAETTGALSAPAGG